MKARECDSHQLPERRGCAPDWARPTGTISRAPAQRRLPSHGRTTPHKTAARKRDDPPPCPPRTTQGEHRQNVSLTATHTSAAMFAKLRFAVKAASHAWRLVSSTTKFATCVWQSERTASSREQSTPRCPHLLFRRGRNTSAREGTHVQSHYLEDAVPL